MNWYMYAMIIAVVLVIFAGILWNILKSPFSYPYYDKDFNVSGKRNPEINDFIDKYIFTAIYVNLLFILFLLIKGKLPL